MNGNNERGRDDEETNDRQSRDTVADRAAARRERLGYDINGVEEWETPSGAWYEVGEVSPATVSVSAEIADGAWLFDADSFGVRSVSITYTATEVYIAVDGREEELGVGVGLSFSVDDARDLGATLFATADPTETPTCRGVSATFTPGSGSASGRAPGLSWNLDGSDTETTVTVVGESPGFRLDVEAVAPNVEARLGVGFTVDGGQELGAAVYQAATDAEMLAELGDVDTDAATGGV